MNLSIYKNNWNEYCVLKDENTLLTYNSSFKSEKDAKEFIEDYNKNKYPKYEVNAGALANAIAQAKYKKFLANGIS